MSLNNYAIYNVRGLSAAMIGSAAEAAQKVVEPDDIKELWLCPDRGMVYIVIGNLPCVGVPHDFGAGASPCL